MTNSILQDRNLKGDSSRWANWESALTWTTCLYCVKNHGKIVDILMTKNKKVVFAHQNCKCIYVPMRTKIVGTATNSGYNGADSILFYLKRLPDYYISKEIAADYGWVGSKGNLDTILPEKMIGGDVYQNKERKLPSVPGRIWYEADINYDGGYRNGQRILYSNDGLIFVSYDHYKTFYEITQ